MYRMTEEEFESAIEDALDEIPEQFIDALENIVIVAEDEPDEYHLSAGEDPDVLAGAYQEGELLGLYDGVNLVDRCDGYEMDAPDVITIFKGPHERLFRTRDEIVTEIGKTVIHEIGHYFGIDDARLEEMGY